MKKYKLILGSQSPRRKHLLKEAGFDFRIDVRSIDESFDPNMDPSLIAEYLSNKKAMEFKGSLLPDELVITADSVVVLQNKTYEKPKDRADAIRIISELSGKTHTVFTGVTLLSLDKKESFTDSTDVSFSILTPQEIEFYIDKCEPYDKAGSYGIQDWLGLCKVSKINGSYANVMGLPVHRVYEALMKF